MTTEQKQQVYQWVLKNEAGYRKECGSDFKTYLIEDAIGKFGSWDQTDQAEEDREEISDICYKALRREVL